MSLVSLPILNLTTLFSYNFSITLIIRGGMPNLARILERREWLMVSKAFTKSTKTHQVSKLCSLRVWRMVLRRNEPCWQPVLGVHPNWYLVPLSDRNTWRRAVMMRLMIFDPVSRRLMPRQFVGRWRLPFFGSSRRLPICQSGMSCVGVEKKFSQWA